MVDPKFISLPPWGKKKKKERGKGKKDGLSERVADQNYFYLASFEKEEGKGGGKERERKSNFLMKFPPPL